MPNSRPRYRGKHRRRSKPRVAVMSAAGTLLVTGAMAGSAQAASADDFARLRMCESSNNYRINTGNGYYGAYQFDLRTWHGLGYDGRPDQASPATQDQAARELQADRGWAPWPACSRKLGLRGSGDASRSQRRKPVVVHTKAAYKPTPAPDFGGTPLRASMVGSVRRDVAVWQLQMRRRGWALAVDGRYGPKSAAAARAFQKALHAKGGGVVGPTTWRLTWEAPTPK